MLLKEIGMDHRYLAGIILLLCSLPSHGQIDTKLVIIGSGPAGLTAALYASRAQLRPLVIEGQHPGGHLTSTTYIENWPGIQKINGLELMNNIKEHAKNSGATFSSESVISLDLSHQPFTIITDENTKITCQSIILAMGSTPRTLHCPGESEYWGKGVATCATCDGPLYKGKEVVIVGGGDSAMEYASFMATYAKSVTIVQMLDILTASAPMQMRVLEIPLIKIIYSSIVSEMHGDGNKLTDLLVTNVNTQEQTTIKADGLFIAIGHVPSTSLLKGQLELDATGHIVVHDKVKTSVPGIFAAGDIMEPFYKQAVIAAGLGSTAALAAERYLMATRKLQSPSRPKKRKISA
jgi:thioredoxin reductase (NADPH)